MATPLMPTYNRLPVAFERGEGAWLWDSEGKQYLDALSGLAVCGLGHAHPAVSEALCAQGKQLVHTSNLYEIPLQTQLAERLTGLAGMENAFFCNSGAEANEAALKIARLYGHRRGIATPTVVVADHAFHGRTLATLTATGSRKAQAGFEPLVRGFLRVAYNDLEALRTIAQNSPHVVAVLVEPIQGEGGVIVPDGDYLAGVRQICDQHQWLMMVDEVQTGIGRTGYWFAGQQGGVVPDVMTLAKALGNGVPIGACLARGEAAQTLTPGTHAATFGGNPLAASAALAVLDTIERDDLLAYAAALGKRMREGLRNELGDCEAVTDIRGVGLMLGVELDRPCGELVERALRRGILINVTAERVIRLLPPLIFTEDEADRVVNEVADLVQQLATASAPH